MSTVEDGRVRLPFMRQPQDAELGPSAIAPPRVSPPLQVIGAIHSGALSVAAISVDIAVLALAAAAVRDPSAWTTALAISLALVCSGRVYRDRDRVVARGFAWWPAVLAGPVAVGILADVLILSHSAARTTVAGVLGLGGLVAVRALAWSVISHRRRAGRDLAPAIVVGDDDRAATLARTLERHREIGLEFAGHVDSSVLLEPVWLAEAAAEHGAAHAFLVPTEGVVVPPALRRALGCRLHVSYVPLVSDALLDSRPSGRVGGVAVLPL